MIGEVRIEVADERGTWIDAGAYTEAGPIASDVQLMPLPAGLRGSNVRVRLTFAKGNWRIGYAALATMDSAVTPVRLAPTGLKRLTGKPSDVRREPDDSTGYLFTYPDDEFRYSFDLPKGAEKYALFLESRGWYYEWMRGEWLEEESPLMSAMLMLNPRQAMRAMAAGYKQRESNYETVFWNSKFGRR
jgi:hypothetical protein